MNSASRTNNMARMVLIAMAACCCLMAPLASMAKDQHVAIVCAHHKTYQQTAAAAKQTLDQKGIACTVLELPRIRNADPEKEEERRSDTTSKATSQPASEQKDPELKRFGRRLKALEPTVIVTIGLTATTFSLETIPDVPIVFCMIPNVLDSALYKNNKLASNRLTGVPIDIKPEQYIKQIKTVSPHADRIGLFISDRSKQTGQAIKAAANKQKVNVELIQTDKQHFPDAVQKLRDKKCDAALMIPDASVYNASNVQALLLWGIREKKPVWAFSTNVVKAGAFAGVSVDNKKLGQQVADLARDILAGAEPKRLGLDYPDATQLAINERTASMIDQMPSRSVLEKVNIRYRKDH
jgi:ABC-type uncharacterized transport system substrate-binding protein